MLTETTTCRAGDQEIMWALKCTLNCHDAVVTYTVGVLRPFEGHGRSMSEEITVGESISFELTACREEETDFTGEAVGFGRFHAIIMHRLAVATARRPPHGASC